MTPLFFLKIIVAADIHYQVVEVYGGNSFSPKPSEREVQNLAKERRHTCAGPEGEKKKSVFKARPKANKQSWLKLCC